MLGGLSQEFTQFDSMRDFYERFEAVKGQPDYVHRAPIGFCSRVLGSCPCCPAANVAVEEIMRAHETGGSTCDEYVQVPMGWNSYDSQVGITDGNGGQGERVALESAAFVAKHLAHLGYEYIVLDAGWFGDNGGSSMHVDQHGRLMPNVTFHPSSANGKVRNGLLDHPP